MTKQKEFGITVTDLQTVMKSPNYAKSQLMPYNPDDIVQKFGSSGQGLDKYETMLNDDAVKAALMTKKSAIIASGWKIEPASEDARDVEIADFITDNLSERYQGNFESSIFEMLSAFEYGFSATEKLYDIADDGSLYLKSLRTRPSHSFEFHTDDYGNLKPDGLKQWTMKGAVPIPEEKMLLYSYNKRDDNIYGNSDLRAAYRCWYTKDFTIKCMNIYIERNSNPIVVGYYDKSTSSDERTDMQTIVDNLSTKTSVIMPEGSKLDFVSSQNQTQVFQSSIDLCNAMIIRAILLPEKMGFGGDTGGSYSLAKVQLNTYLWILEKVRHELETILNENLIREMVDYNFGIQDKYPKFKFNPLTEDDKNEKSKTLIDAVSRGAISMNLETENFLRTLMGVPKTEEDIYAEPEGASGGSEDPTLEGGASPDGGDDASGNGNGKAGDASGNKSNNGDGDQQFDARHGKELKLRRMPRGREHRYDFKLINKTLDTTLETGIKDLKDILRKIRDDFTSQIVRKKMLETKNIQAAKDAEFRFIRDYALEVEGILRGSYDDGRKTAKTAYSDFKKANAKVTSGIGLVKGKSLVWIKEQAKIITSNISEGLQAKAKQTLLSGVLNGDATNVIVTKIDELFGKYVAEEMVEGYDFAGNALYTDVNTGISRAFAAGMGEVNSDLEATGDIVAYEWTSIIDANTTEGCQDLDSIIYEVSDPVWDRLHYPRHWNCRSLTMAVFAGEEYAASEDIGVYDEF